MGTRRTVRTLYRDDHRIIVAEAPTRHAVWTTGKIVDLPVMWTVFFMQKFRQSTPWLYAVAACTERPKYDTPLLYPPYGNMYYMRPCFYSAPGSDLTDEAAAHRIIADWWGSRFSSDGEGPSWWSAVAKARSRIGGMRAMGSWSVDDVLAADWSCMASKPKRVLSLCGSPGLTFPTVRSMVELKLP